MKTIVSIVEGDGEVAALPILLRRIGQWLSPELHCHVLPPIRVRRDQFLNREDVFRRQLELASLKCTNNGWILVLLDADDDCPAELGSAIVSRAQKVIPHKPVSVVLANKEYEAWFIASASSMHGERGFSFVDSVHDPESIRGAKEWLSERKQEGRYREVTDQPALSARMDIKLARQNSRSFHKLCSEWEKNMHKDPMVSQD